MRLINRLEMIDVSAIPNESRYFNVKNTFVDAAFEHTTFIQTAFVHTAFAYTAFTKSTNIACLF